MIEGFHFIVLQLGLYDTQDFGCKTIITFKLFQIGDAVELYLDP